MKFEDAMPLISATGNLIATLVNQILASNAMTEEQRKEALFAALALGDEISAKVKNVKFDGFKPQE